MSLITSLTRLLTGSISTATFCSPSEAELRDHPNRVEAMRRASLKGWRYAMDHPDEIITLLLEIPYVEKTGNIWSLKLPKCVS